MLTKSTSENTASVAFPYCILMIYRRCVYETPRPQQGHPRSMGQGYKVDVTAVI